MTDQKTFHMMTTADGIALAVLIIGSPEDSSGAPVMHQIDFLPWVMVHGERDTEATFKAARKAWVDLLGR